MLVECILPRAGERLTVIDGSKSIRHAADLMAQPHIGLLVICEGTSMAGVVTKTDIVTYISSHLGAGLETPVNTIMTRDVVSCCATDPLIDVWRAMQAQGFQRIPVIGGARTPIGVVHTRDVLQRLFCDAEVEDELLRDYISGVGYR